MEAAHAVRRPPRRGPAARRTSSGARSSTTSGRRSRCSFSRSSTPLGVAWLRIASAALVFAPWRRPWRTLAALDCDGRRLVVALGRRARRDERVLLRRDRPAAAGDRRGDRVPAGDRARGARRADAAERAALVARGRAASTCSRDVQLAGEPARLRVRVRERGAVRAYIVLAHRVARHGAVGGIDGLAAAMLVALVVVTPLGARRSRPALRDPVALAAGIGVGVSSSVIPYVSTSSRWRGCRARRTRCSSRCCRRPRRWSDRRARASSRPPSTSPGSRSSSAASPPTATRPDPADPVLPSVHGARTWPAALPVDDHALDRSGEHGTVLLLRNPPPPWTVLTFVAATCTALVASAARKPKV